MQLTAGTILASSEIMDDENFKNCFLLVTEYNENGAVAFVINKEFGRPLNALAEFSSSTAFPLFHGGPVDDGHLFFVHRRSDIIKGGALVTDQLFVGGNFSAAVQMINSGKLTAADIKIFIGYCGWEARELEAEIEEGSWLMTNHTIDRVFDSVLED